MIIEHSSPRPGTRQTTTNSSSRKQTLTSGEEVPEPEELRRSLEAAREEARLILEGEHDRLRALRQQEAKRRHEEREKQRQEEARQREAEAAAEREVEEAAQRLAALKEARHQRKSDPQNQPAPEKEPQKDGQRSKLRTLVIGGPSSPESTKHRKHRRVVSAVETLREYPKQVHARNNSASRIDQIPAAQAQTAAIGKPNFDAPISAVNAGERRVSVKCKEASITLPVTPSTTTKDILNSASLCMSEPIDPRTAILLESFSQLGLERPLRRYERVRDVMNSWDSDGQNHLYIMPASECAAPGLQVTDAPREQPYGTTVQIYHSQRPGKWDKRWLKLREDGQITTSKNENGIDATNICHVSDFDLYTPTTKQIKKLKPPKKLCYALKSQQKSAVFLEGANFVHFFCTKDKDVADRWYRNVHSWRSWYLVNMLGEGQREEKADTPQGMLHLGPRPGTSNSKESLPYVLGSFKPLLDFSSVPEGLGTTNPEHGLPVRRPSHSAAQRPLIDFASTRPSDQDEDSWTGAGPKFSHSHPHSTAAPPTAFPRRFVVEPTTTTAAAAALDPDDGFTGKGLLARSASRRTQGGTRTGRGVAGVDGKPLVDLAPTSEFTDGSLLRRMETIRAAQGGLEPRIDRRKGREVDVPVGEGYG